jgi:hypothetical protein
MTEALNLPFYLILVHLNVNSHMDLTVSIISTVLVQKTNCTDRKLEPREYVSDMFSSLGSAAVLPII